MRALHRLVGFVREVGAGINAGNAIRHGLPVPEHVLRLAHPAAGLSSLWWRDAVERTRR